MSKIHAAITAVGGYVPDYILTNKELETMVETNDEWIVSRTGIKERRILKGEGKATSDLAVPAVQQLLEKRGIAATDIDLIIFCTSTPDMLFPATANILADKIGAKNAWGYDLQAACSGFLFGLTTGVQFIESGKHKKVLVVGADKMSSVVNYQDRNTCILFGDGCGVVLLEPNTDGMGIQDSILKTDGSGGQYLNIKGGGSLNPASHATVDAGLHYAYQEGKTVFKFAVTNMANVAAEIMEKNNLQASDIAYLVPHQANKRIIDATAERAGLPEEKVMINIQKYGNTTSATIPLCLWEWENKLKKGDNLILAAFGGGFTWGSVYLKWAY
ncbi:ketoacyl-ACP synthase III [Sphingobacterium faecium]|jgi:3-oxoacyl-[acyl-carrier-protein] synthase-3|uniref:beta-ketoacyl-ACP synthase III n=1 Tax=Sphingobacterium faecium TaxID=34087 RepID=UPI000D3D7880|nr:beta-ketoacyl-ACP synthase III [Sphingobacterium faecium]PTX07843.1 3-oxoacyl-[acyl-carrier-protein] synthase-3 [Sphingobacterium faecium]UXD68490.1 ketoacyl-ACP synthase III [Sphingobacterium faecium]GEM65620.1 3-oxoacyl-[acyl-carrier-protein] synthase 3 [Sphingobacterium faecium NBRC 15299]